MAIAKVIKETERQMPLLGELVRTGQDIYLCVSLPNLSKPFKEGVEWHKCLLPLSVAVGVAGGYYSMNILEDSPFEIVEEVMLYNEYKEETA